MAPMTFLESLWLTLVTLAEFLSQLGTSTLEPLSLYCMDKAEPLLSAYAELSETLSHASIWTTFLSNSLLYSTPILLYQLLRHPDIIVPDQKIDFRAWTHFCIGVSFVMYNYCFDLFEDPAMGPQPCRYRDSDTQLWDCIEAACVGVLFMLNYRRAPTPSFALSAYLAGSIINKTAILVTSPSTTFSTAISSKLFHVLVFYASMLCLHETPKIDKVNLGLQHYAGVQFFYGLFGKSLAIWLHPTFHAGSKDLLTEDDLNGLPHELLIDEIHLGFRRLVAKYRHLSSGLSKACFALTRKDVYSSITANAIFIMLELTTPRLVEQAVLIQQSWLDPTKSVPEAWTKSSLLFMTFLVFLGITISRGLGMHYESRATTTLQGALLGSVFTKLMRLPEETITESARVSLLSTDIPGALCLLPAYTRLTLYLVRFIFIPLMLWPHIGWMTPVVLAMAVGIYTVIGYLRSSHPAMMRELHKKRQKREMHVSRLLYKLKEVAMTERGPAFYKVMNEMRDDELTTFSTYQGKLARLYSFLNLTTALFPPLALVAHWTSPEQDGTYNLAATLKCFVLLVIWAESSEPLMEVASFKQALNHLLTISTFLSLAEPEISNDEPSEDTDQEEIVPALSDGNMIELHDVSIAAKRGAQVVLKNVTLSCQEQRVTVITGKSGSGKSVLARALLGQNNVSGGRITVHESGNLSIAFCGQRSWLQSRSIKSNIIGSKRFEQEWYNEVIEACSLTEDLLRYPGGDSFILGRHGLHLNEAECQKIAIARALYSRAKLVIFDDPFDILDCFTADSIIACLLGPKGKFKKNKSTVVLMTRDPGPFCNVARRFFTINDQGQISRKSTRRIRQFAEERRQKSMEALESIEQDVLQIQPHAAPKGATLQLSYRPPHSKLHMAPLSFYFQFADKSLIFVWCITLIATVLFSLSLYILIALGYADTPASFSPIIFIGLLSGPAVGATGYTFYGQLAVQVSGKLHTKLLGAVLRSPITLSNPNKLPSVILLFNEGMRVITIDLPRYIFQTTYQFGLGLLALCILAWANPTISFAFPIILMPAYLMKRFYVETSRQIYSLQLDSNASLEAHFLESAAGASYVQAFQWNGRQVDEIFDAINKQQRLLYHSLSIKQWLVVAGNAFVTFSCIPLLAFVFTENASPACVGMAFGSCFYFQYIVQWGVIPWFNLDDGLTTLDEVKQLIEMRPEPVWANEPEVPTDEPIELDDDVPVDLDAAAVNGQAVRPLAQPEASTQTQIFQQAPVEGIATASGSTDDTVAIERQETQTDEAATIQEWEESEHNGVTSDGPTSTIVTEETDRSSIASDIIEVVVHPDSSKSVKGKERAHAREANEQPEVHEHNELPINPDEPLVPEITEEPMVAETTKGNGSHHIEKENMEGNAHSAIEVPESWPARGRIEFRDVTIWYNSHDRPVLKDISLTIYDDTEAGFHGPVGCGKTALLLAILNMLPYKGSITVDGIEVRTIPSPDLRSRFTVIPQEVIIFPGSVRQNLNSDEFFTPPKTIVVPGEGEVKAHSDILERILKRLGLWGIIKGCGGLDADMSEIPLTPSQEYRFSIAQALTRFFFTQSKVTLVDNVTSLVPHSDCVMMRQAMRELINDGSVLAVGQHRSALIGSDAVGELKDGTAYIQPRGSLDWDDNGEPSDPLPRLFPRRRPSSPSDPLPSIRRILAHAAATAGPSHSSGGRAHRETAYPLPPRSPKHLRTAGPSRGARSPSPRYHSGGKARRDTSYPLPRRSSRRRATAESSRAARARSNSPKYPLPSIRRILAHAAATAETSHATRAPSPTPGPSEVARSPPPTPGPSTVARSASPIPGPYTEAGPSSPILEPPCTTQSPFPAPEGLDAVILPSPEPELPCASLPSKPRSPSPIRGRSRTARRLEDIDGIGCRSRSLTPKASPRLGGASAEVKERSRSLTPKASRSALSSTEVEDRSRSLTPRPRYATNYVPSGLPSATSTASTSEQSGPWSSTASSQIPLASNSELDDGLLPSRAFEKQPQPTSESSPHSTIPYKQPSVTDEFSDTFILPATTYQKPSPSAAQAKPRAKPQAKPQAPQRRGKRKLTEEEKDKLREIIHCKIALIEERRRERKIEELIYDYSELRWLDPTTPYLERMCSAYWHDILFVHGLTRGQPRIPPVKPSGPPFQTVMRTLDAKIRAYERQLDKLDGKERKVRVEFVVPPKPKPKPPSSLGTPSRPKVPPSLRETTRLQLQAQPTQRLPHSPGLSDETTRLRPIIRNSTPLFAPRPSPLREEVHFAPPGRGQQEEPPQENTSIKPRPPPRPPTLSKAQALHVVPQNWGGAEEDPSLAQLLKDTMVMDLPMSWFLKQKRDELASLLLARGRSAPPAPGVPLPKPAQAPFRRQSRLRSAHSRTRRLDGLGPVSQFKGQLQKPLPEDMVIRDPRLRAVQKQK